MYGIQDKPHVSGSAVLLKVAGRYRSEYGSGSMRGCNKGDWPFSGVSVSDVAEQVFQDSCHARSDSDATAREEFAIVHCARLDVIQLADPAGTVINSIGMKLGNRSPDHKAQLWACRVPMMASWRR